jgi:hypothetical protein
MGGLLARTANATMDAATPVEPRGPRIFPTDRAARAGCAWTIAVDGDRILLSHSYLTVVLPRDEKFIAVWSHGPAHADQPEQLVVAALQVLPLSTGPASESRPPLATAADFIVRSAIGCLGSRLQPLTPKNPYFAWGRWSLSHRGGGVFEVQRLGEDGTLVAVGFLRPAGLHGCGAAMLWDDQSEDLPLEANCSCPVSVPLQPPAPRSPVTGMLSNASSFSSLPRLDITPQHGAATPPSPDNFTIEASVIRECIVCLTNSASHVLVPCGHLVLCGACVTPTLHSSPACPLCRVPTQRVMKVFT